MPRQKAFEELVLEARAGERERYSTAMAADRGPMPYSRNASEEQQDRMWAFMEPTLKDPARFALLTTPKEQGGNGMTPLAASYARYPYRQQLVEGAGQSISDQIAYAEKRKARMLTIPVAGQVEPAQQTAPPDQTVMGG